MRIIGFVAETASVTRILEHIGVPATPPRFPRRAIPQAKRRVAANPVTRLALQAVF